MRRDWRQFHSSSGTAVYVTQRPYKIASKLPASYLSFEFLVFYSDHPNDKMLALDKTPQRVKLTLYGSKSTKYDGQCYICVQKDHIFRCATIIRWSNKFCLLPGSCHNRSHYIQ